VDKRALIRPFQVKALNPVVKRLAGTRLLPGYALLETLGRRSGQPRRTPVGNGLDGRTFWIVTEYGRRASYVRNIEAEPRVRVRVKGTWHSGTARVLPDDDARERQRLLGRRLNAAVVRLAGTEHLTVRIDLDG
jgi:deazaflavin-dependent oxidoreductase (nitroreductase family)